MGVQNASGIILKRFISMGVALFSRHFEKDDDKREKVLSFYVNCRGPAWQTIQMSRDSSKIFNNHYCCDRTISSSTSHRKKSFSSRNFHFSNPRAHFSINFWAIISLNFISVTNFTWIDKKKKEKFKFFGFIQESKFKICGALNNTTWL